MWAVGCAQRVRLCSFGGVSARAAAASCLLPRRVACVSSSRATATISRSRYFLHDVTTVRQLNHVSRATPPPPYFSGMGTSRTHLKERLVGPRPVASRLSRRVRPRTHDVSRARWLSRTERPDRPSAETTPSGRDSVPVPAEKHPITAPSPTSTPADVPIDPRVWRIAASSLLMGVAIGVVLPLMPVFVQELGFTPSQFGMVVGVLGLTRLACNIPAAWAGDRFGRRPLLYMGPGFNAWGMGAMATATTLNELVFYRFLTGVGGATQMTGASLYLSDISTPLNRARTMAPMATAFSAGAVVGPAIGGYLADMTYLAFPFYLTGLVTAIAGVNNYLLPETLPKEVAAATRAHSKSLRQEFVSTLRQWQPLLRNSDIRCILLTHFSYWVTAAGCIFTLLPLVATNQFGLSSSALGSFFGMMAMVNVLGSQPAAMLSDRLGRKSALVPGLMIAASAVILMPLSTSVSMLAGCALLWGVGSTTLGSTPTAFVADRTTASNRSQALALLRSAGDLGLMLGPFGAGALAQFAGTVPAYFTFASLLLCALINFHRKVANEVPRPLQLNDSNAQVSTHNNTTTSVVEQNQAPGVAAEVAATTAKATAKAATAVPCATERVMNYTVVVVEEDEMIRQHQSFDSIMARFEDSPVPVLVWIAPRVDDTTGESWCPDADRGAAHVRRLMNQVGGVLLHFPVRVDTAYNAEHALRRHAKLRFRSVPSLYLWDSSKGQQKPVMCLVEAQCCDEKEITAMARAADRLAKEQQAGVGQGQRQGQKQEEQEQEKGPEIRE